MKTISFVSVIVLLITITFSSCAHKIQKTGWRGPERDGRIEGFRSPDQFSDSLTLAWKIYAGEGDSSPILSSDRLYLNTKIDSAEQLLCIDPETGTILWKTPINEAPSVEGPSRGHAGPRSTPAYANGKILTLGASGIVACINAESGILLWKNESYTHEVPAFYTSASPLVEGQLCILHLGGREEGVITALDINSGEEVWSIWGEPCTYSSARMWRWKEPLVLIQTEKDLLGISLEGEIKWRIATPSEKRFYNIPTPQYYQDIIIIPGQGNGTTAYRISSKDGDYTVNELWYNDSLGVSFSTPVIRDTIMFGNHSSGGNLFALDVLNGQQLWKDSIPRNRMSTILDLGNALMSSDNNGNLVFFKPDDDRFIPLASYHVSDSKVSASPAFKDNKIYVKDFDMLSCWILE